MYCFDRCYYLSLSPQYYRKLFIHSFIYLHQINGPCQVKQTTKETRNEHTQTPKIEHIIVTPQRIQQRYHKGGFSGDFDMRNRSIEKTIVHAPEKSGLNFRCRGHC